MKIKQQKRMSRKAIGATIAVLIALCAAIILGLIFNAFYLWFGAPANVQSELSAVIRESTYNGQNLVLSLIGVAISVWIGLNIYNVLSKEELEELLDQAERAAEITERVYTEVLLSKFRVSFSDRTVSCLTARLEAIDKLPDTVLEKLIELEDIFSFSYNLYADGLPTAYNEVGEQQAAQLQESVFTYKKEGKLNSEQYSFLLGYISLRRADFSYFQAQYGECDGEKRKKLAENAIEQYKKTIFNLFGTRDITLCTKPELYLPEERQSIAFLANDIGSTYLLFMPQLTNEELDFVISAEKVAIEFAEEIAPATREIFARNLGVAYERKGEMEKAFEQYCKAFELNHRSWKAAHCIGSWYRKQIYKRFPNIPNNLIIDEEIIADLRDEERTELLEKLERSAYWYELKRINNNGMTEDWLITLYRCMYQLTNGEKYKVKLEILSREKAYRQEALTKN